MRRPTSNFNTLNLDATARARFIFSLVNAAMAGVMTNLAAGIAKIAGGSASEFDRLLQNLSHCLIKFFESRVVEFLSGSKWVDSGFP